MGRYIIMLYYYYYWCTHSFLRFAMGWTPSGNDNVFSGVHVTEGFWGAQRACSCNHGRRVSGCWVQRHYQCISEENTSPADGPPSHLISIGPADVSPSFFLFLFLFFKAEQVFLTLILFFFFFRQNYSFLYQYLYTHAGERERERDERLRLY